MMGAHTTVHHRWPALAMARALLLAGVVVFGLPSLLAAADPGAVVTTLLSLPRTGQISTYDQSGKPIPFKGSGQDGEFQRGELWPDPRFINNGDNTISDALTGLMWFNVGNCFGPWPWPAALQTVEEFNQGTITCLDHKSKHHDWFLPGVDQLHSLLDAEAGVVSEELRLAGFAQIENSLYWSATPYQGRLKAWGVDFANGQVLPVNKLEGHLLLMARVERAAKGAPAKAEGTPPSSAPQGKGPGAATPPPQRFVDHGDGTVTDTATGLMWLRDGSCLSGLDWQQALVVGRRLLGGEKGTLCPALRSEHGDWSLPNSNELRSLIDYGHDYPALHPNHPFTQMAAGYWTATTVAATPAQGFIVDVDTGALMAVPKSARHRALLVRQMAPGPERPRMEAGKGGNLGVRTEYVLTMDPAMVSEIHWPPPPRFMDNGDGTSMDALTGINWLTDANCFGKQSWTDIAAVLERFNAVKAKAGKTDVTCKGYENSADDWEMPTLRELQELVNPEVKDGALWLNQQGVNNVQGGGDYWSATQTPLNLYFADAVNLKSGKASNYPKTLKFFIWPKRRAAEEKEFDEPLVNLTANAIGGLVTLSPKDPISFVGSLYTFGLRLPADFWFWYDTPDEKRLWLTPIRTWTDVATPLYQGPLFNLNNYEIYRTVANGLVPGVYEFHFAVDTIANGTMDEPVYEGAISVVIPGGPE